MTGQQRLHAGKHRILSECRAKRRQVRRDGGQMGRGAGLRMGENRRNVTGEDQVAVDLGIIERLDAQPISGDKAFPGNRVPDDKGKHAIQLLQAIGTIFLVGVQDHLCIGGGFEPVAFGNQCFPLTNLEISLKSQFCILRSRTFSEIDILTQQHEFPTFRRTKDT